MRVRILSDEYVSLPPPVTIEIVDMVKRRHGNPHPDENWRESVDSEDGFSVTMWFESSGFALVLGRFERLAGTISIPSAGKYEIRFDVFVSDDLVLPAAPGVRNRRDAVIFGTN